MAIPLNLPKGSNTQGLWRFDDNFNDSSSNNNHLTETSGTIPFVTGKIGKAGDFELDDTEWLEIADASQVGLDPAGSFSIAAWVNPESANINRVIVGKDVAGARQYALIIDAANKIYVLVFNAAQAYTESTATTALGTATWYHVAVTYQYIGAGTSKINLYLNGASDRAEITNAIGPVVNTATAFRIGAREFGGAENYFDGLIDEVIFWNTNLTAAEVLQVKNITAYQFAGGFSGGQPWIFMKDMWEKHNKLWAPKGLLLPKDLGFQM